MATLTSNWLEAGRVILSENLAVVARPDMSALLHLTANEEEIRPLPIQDDYSSYAAALVGNFHLPRGGRSLISNALRFSSDEGRLLVEQAYLPDFASAKQHAKAIFASAQVGECDQASLKKFSEELDRLLPAFTDDLVERFRQGRLSLTEVQALFARVYALKRFAYEGISGLLILEEKNASLVTDEFRALTSCAAELKYFGNELKQYLKHPDKIDNIQLWLQEKKKILQAAALQVSEFSGFEVLMREFSTLIATIESCVSCKSTELLIKLTSCIAQTQTLAANTHSLAMGRSNEALKKSLRATITAFTQQLEKFLPAVFSYEQELISWSVLNAVRLNATDRVAYFEHLRYIGNFFLEEMKLERENLSHLPATLRLNDIRAAHQYRQALANGMILPDHLRPNHYADKPADIVDRIPLFDRKTGDFDNSYRNAGAPPRYYDLALGTALTWFWQPGYDSNSNPAKMMVTPTDAALVAFGHGTSAFYSNSGATLGAANSIINEGEDAHKKRIYGGLTYDLDAHGFGLYQEPVGSDAEIPERREQYWQWELAIYQYLSLFGVPQILWGRSFSGNKALDLPLRDPNGLFKAVWAMSPYKKEWVAYTMGALQKSNIALNEEGDRWSGYIDGDWLWERDETVGKHPCPVLITYSPDDIEYPPEELKTYWKQRYGGLPGYLIAVFPGGAHNLFETANVPVYRAVRKLGQWWVKEILSGNKDPQVPESLVEELQKIKETQVKTDIKKAFLADDEEAEKLLVKIPSHLKDIILQSLSDKVRQDTVGNVLTAKKLNQEIEKLLVDIVAKGGFAEFLPQNVQAELTQLIKEAVDNNRVRLDGNVLIFGFEK